jgi:hypothetical protein
VGETITVVSKTDLRLLTQPSFKAAEIILPSQPTSLIGRILSLQGDILTVSGYPLSLSPTSIASSSAKAAERTFQVTISKETEISQLVPEDPLKPSKPQKLDPSDLKVGLEVKIYSDSDVSTTDKVTALKIEPVVVIIKK